MGCFPALLLLITLPFCLYLGAGAGPYGFVIIGGWVLLFLIFSTNADNPRPF